MVMAHNAPRATGVVPVGGEHFTQDIAVGLRTPLWEAERLKRVYGCAGRRWLREDALVEVTGGSGRVVSRRALAEIIEARAAELLALVRADLLRSGNERPLGSGVVLTGGGAQLEALAELAEQIFQMPARVGKPSGILGLTTQTGAPHPLKDPAFATLAGLVLHGNRIRQLRRRPAGVLGRLKNLWTRPKSGHGKGWAA
jgi:cell division protein FtsA